MLFIFICVHEDMKKIPAGPLLIGYGLAGIGLVLSRIDLGVSGSPFLVLRPPFLPLMEEKEQKKIKASGTPAKLAGYLNSTNKHLINSTSFTFRFSLPRWPDRGGRRLARLC